MKKITFLIPCLIISGMNVFAQQVIKANNARNHVGEQVVVADAVYSIKTYNDSTSVIHLGGKNLNAAISIIVNFNSKLKSDARFLRKLKDARVAVTGFIVLLEGQPAIILTKKEKLKVLPNVANRKWLSFSIASHKQILLAQR